MESFAMDMDSFKEWNEYIERKKEIELWLVFLHEYFKVLSELVVFKVVDNRGKAVIGNDNLIRTEWLSAFPVLSTVRIWTCGPFYVFRLEVLLEVMESVCHSVTWIVADDGFWIE